MARVFMHTSEGLTRLRELRQVGGYGITETVHVCSKRASLDFMQSG
jgi:hypothetical protein